MSDQATDLMDRLTFFFATDGLKHIQRANYTSIEPRFETVAEHSWHVTLLAMILEDCAPEGVDHNHVRDLLTVHDLVEVYAGDTVIWDEISETEVKDRELRAGERLMALLPEEPQRSRLDPLWREYQAQETLNARYARALDALHPPLMSFGFGGHGHQRVDLTPSRVLARKRPLIEPFPQLWALLQSVLEDAVKTGLIQPDEIHQP